MMMEHSDWVGIWCLMTAYTCRVPFCLLVSVHAASGNHPVARPGTIHLCFISFVTGTTTLQRLYEYYQD